MLKIKWKHLTIVSNEDAETMRNNFRATGRTAAAFDTETSGLSHIYDLPFLYQFGWYDKETMCGWTYVVDLETHPVLARQVIKVWHALVKSVPKYLAHNVKFDLSMVENIGLPYRGDNISDTQIWIRLGTDAIQEKYGGASLKLKRFAEKYITSDAKNFESKIKLERTQIAKALNLKLQKRLGWRKKDIDDFFKDSLNEAEDLPEDKRQAYADWHMYDLPLYLQDVVTGAVESDMIRYNTLNRANVIEYGHYDIVWVLEAFHILHASVEARGNMDAVKLEEANIYPLLDMERVGFKADKEYLKECKNNMKAYILQRRQDLCTIAGQEVSVGQHALLKTILSELGVETESTSADELELIVADLKHNDDNPTAVDFIETIMELRTLEKWYSTYIMRFMRDLKRGDMLYTTIHQSGAVSGRVTSDFQQFPRDPVKSITGEELFYPRKMFLVPDGYKGIIYLDYSQVELRLQAMYTILVGHPDTNLCRAYMPYNCYSKKYGSFDYNNEEHLKHVDDTHWYLYDEPAKEWVPTDVHGATTKTAFNIDESHPDFHSRRYDGKRVNFAKNYGATYERIKVMLPHYDEETLHKIDEAYYLTFPGIKVYHEYCYKIAKLQAYAQNLFGVKYYNVSGHNLKNMLIQGTGAYILKIVIPKINEYLKRYNYKSKLQMQIHDELSFLWHPDDSPKLFFALKAIMEDWKGFLVPIVADMEVTYTNWAEKQEVKSLKDLE